MPAIQGLESFQEIKKLWWCILNFLTLLTVNITYRPSLYISSALIRVSHVLTLHLCYLRTNGLSLPVEHILWSGCSELRRRGCYGALHVHGISTRASVYIERARRDQKKHAVSVARAALAQPWT